METMRVIRTQAPQQQLNDTLQRENMSLKILGLLFSLSYGNDCLA